MPLAARAAKRDSRPIGILCDRSDRLRRRDARTTPVWYRQYHGSRFQVFQHNTSMERASRLAQKSTVSCVLNQSMFEKIRRVRWHTLLQQQTCSTRRSTKVRVWLANHSLQERMWELPPNCGPDLCGLVQTGDMACQGPNSLRITSHVLPAAVSFAQNLSRGARSSSARAMM